jgi:hypothetical protein
MFLFPGTILGKILEITSPLATKKASTPGVTFKCYRYVPILLRSNDINLEELSHSYKEIKNFIRHYISASIGGKC